MTDVCVLCEYAMLRKLIGEDCWAYLLNRTTMLFATFGPTQAANSAMKPFRDCGSKRFPFSHATRTLH